MNILLTGGSGQVGQSLQQLSWPDGLRLYAPPRSELDLSSEASVSNILASRSWAAIINAGAYTAVDAAESDSLMAWKVNALAPALISYHSRVNKIPLLHISTDYVFSGKSPRPWEEDDPVGPLSVYGASKEAGEQAVRTSMSQHLILRTSWVVSPFGKNFVKTMLRLAQERSELRVVGDQMGRPTIAADLALVIRALVLRMIAADEAVLGTYHAANESETCWADFARAIFEASAKLGGPQARVESIKTQDYPTPAQRPLYSTLSTSRLAQNFGLTMPSWRDHLSELISAVLTAQGKAS
jgi:dTDP-4-dehydrorhamnose reductase